MLIFSPDLLCLFCPLVVSLHPSGCSRVTQATEKAKMTLQNSIDKAENICGAASDAIQSAIDAIVKNWMDSHPAIFWLVSHPPIGLAMLLLFILIILGWFQALGSFFCRRMVIYFANTWKIYTRGFQCRL